MSVPCSSGSFCPPALWWFVTWLSAALSKWSRSRCTTSSLAGSTSLPSSTRPRPTEMPGLWSRPSFEHVRPFGQAFWYFEIVLLYDTKEQISCLLASRFPVFVTIFVLTTLIALPFGYLCPLLILRNSLFCFLLSLMKDAFVQRSWVAQKIFCWGKV